MHAARTGCRSLIPAVSVLPDDLWARIAGFLQSPLLSHVSSRLWGLLQGYHLKCAVDPLNAAQLAQALSRAHTLGIIGKHMTDCDTDALLKDLHKVSTLTHFRFSLWCRTNQVAARGLQSLTALRLAPALQALDVDLYGCEIGAPGAQQLSELGTSASLRHLTLGLRFNRLGCAGAVFVSRLKGLRALSSLTLDLGYNHVGDEGAEALADLGEAPALEGLVLLLDNNGIGDRGAAALAKLYSATTVRDLTLNLKNNAVGDHGATALSAFGLETKLASLDLNVQGNAGVGDVGHQALRDMDASISSIPGPAPRLVLCHFEIPPEGPKVSLFTCLSHGSF